MDSFIVPRRVHIASSKRPQWVGIRGGDHPKRMRNGILMDNARRHHPALEVVESDSLPSLKERVSMETTILALRKE